MKRVNAVSAIGAATAGTSAAMVAAVASACCVGPSVAPLLISVLGASGLIALTWLRPYTPLLLILSAALLAFSFRRAYAPSSCAQGEGVPRSVKLARVVTWLAALLWLLSAGDSIYGFLHE